MGKPRREEVDDDIFENGSDVPLEDEEDEYDDDDDVEVENEMFPLELSDSEEEEDDDEDKDDDDQEVKIGWGHKKRTFYQDEEDAEEDEDEAEAAIEEEKEATELRKKKIATLRPEDFEDTIEEETLGSASKQKTRSFNHKEDLEEGTTAIAIEKLSLAEAALLSKEEKLELLKNDSPELFQLLDDFKDNLSVLKSKILPLLQKVKSGELPTSKGISFLELKFHLLLSYCLNISYYLLLKAEGKQVKEHPVIDSLVRIRSIIDKLRPLDKKLKYQVDKLVKLATLGKEQQVEETTDALKFKPNPNALLGAEDLNKKERKSKKATSEAVSAKYVPPRVAAARFEDDHKRQSKVSRAEKSSMLSYLKDQYGDAPEEITSTGSSKKNVVNPEDTERQRYEEDYFLRLTENGKKNKKPKKNINSLAEEFEDLEDFSDLAGLDTTETSNTDPSSSFLQKRSLSDIINNLEGKQKSLSADQDVAYRNIEASRETMRKRRSTIEGEDSIIPLDPSDDTSEFDDLFEEQEKTAKKRRVEQKGKKQIQLRPVAREEEIDGNKRKVTREIEKNKGLTPYRKKENRNPRVKHKKKYDKAVRKQKSVRTGMADTKKPYGGEKTGIKPSITRSISLKS